MYYQFLLLGWWTGACKLICIASALSLAADLVR